MRAGWRRSRRPARGSRPSRTPSCSWCPATRSTSRRATPSAARGPPWTSSIATAALPNLDELQRLAARALDHDRARVAEGVRLLEEAHALLAELRDPPVEIADAERDVIVEVAARARERRVVLPHVAGQRDVPEHHCGRRCAKHSLSLERRPGALASARHTAAALRHAGGSRAAREHGGAEVR